MTLTLAELTDRQVDVIRFWRAYEIAQGRPPKLREAGESLGMSKVTVHEHLHQLEKKGLVALGTRYLARNRTTTRAARKLLDRDRFALWCELWGQLSEDEQVVFLDLISEGV